MTSPDPDAQPPSPTTRDVQYKGAPLDSEKGPGLGCFWSQVVVLGLLIILTPLSVVWNWPALVSGGLLIAVLVLLLFAGQTVIFLLRLVAADRRAAGRRRPLASSTRTVGELEDQGAIEVAARTDPAPDGTPPTAPDAPDAGLSADAGGDTADGVRE